MEGSRRKFVWAKDAGSQTPLEDDIYVHRLIDKILRKRTHW